MSEPLETGPYFISSVSFATGEPVSRSLGESEDAIVVLPLGSPPPVWSLTKFPSGRYIFELDGRMARVVNGSLQLTDPGFPEFPFEWTILQGAPSPPPIGTDNFGIFVPNKQPSEIWTIGSTEGDQAIPVPVKIGNAGSSIHIFSTTA